MNKEKPRLVRLAAIVTQLQSKRIVTAKQIAEKHQVSIRTVYRDIRALEASGIPIFTEEGKGYSLIEGFTLPPVMFAEDEANALITAEQLLAKTKDESLITHYGNAINKIKAVLNYSQKDKVQLLSERLQVRAMHNETITSRYLIQLQKAITNYFLVTLKYKSLQNKTTQRTIEPFALVHTQTNWVLIAFCRLRNDFRAFRLDCMQTCTVTTQVFEPHNMTLQHYFKKYFPSS